LEDLADKYSIKNLRYTLPVKYLNIVGIYGEIDKRPINIEVLDKTNSMADGENPTGLYALKFRLMRQKNCDVIMVSGK
jgi:hypothetical protein